MARILWSAFSRIRTEYGKIRSILQSFKPNFLIFCRAQLFTKTKFLLRLNNHVGTFKVVVANNKKWVAIKFSRLFVNFYDYTRQI